MQTVKCDADGLISDSDNRRAMRGPLRALAFMILLLQGCGGGSAGSNPTATGFINQTQHTDAELWALWNATQQNLSQ
jgi:hypothetical protein